MGRKKYPMVGVRLTVEQHASLRGLAARWEVTPTDVLRASLLSLLSIAEEDGEESAQLLKENAQLRMKLKNLTCQSAVSQRSR